MRRLFPILAATAVLATSAAQAAVRDYPVGGFDRIEVAGPYRVTVTTGGRPAVRANGADRALERLVVEVRGHTLYIGSKSGWSGMWGVGMGMGADMDKVVVDVAAPPLRAAQLTGSGDLIIDRAGGPAFDLAVTGSGGATVRAAEAQRFAVAVVGSGDATVIGRARSIDATLRGSGDIHGERLSANEALVSLTGSGAVALSASGRATVNLTGSGDVRITGGARCTVAKHGSGDVRCG